MERTQEADIHLVKIIFVLVSCEDISTQSRAGKPAQEKLRGIAIGSFVNFLAVRRLQGKSKRFLMDITLSIGDAHSAQVATSKLVGTTVLNTLIYNHEAQV